MNKDEYEKKDRGISKKWQIAGTVSIVLAIGLPFFIMMISHTKFTVQQISTLGAVGDFLGGSTIGLLSIASIFFIIHTISIQSKELSMQRTELMLTRNELAETRKIHESSHKTMLKQQFENTFFNMLSLHNEIVHSIHFEDGNKVYNGRAIFKKLRQHMNNQLRKLEEKLEESLSGHLQAIEEAVSITAKDFSETTAHYFKNIWTLLVFLDQEKILTDEEKEKYINVIKSQLSPYELIYLLYLSFKKENQGFFILTKKYKLFLEIDKDLLLHHADCELYQSLNEKQKSKSQ